MARSPDFCPRAGGLDLQGLKNLTEGKRDRLLACLGSTSQSDGQVFGAGVFLPKFAHKKW